MNFSVIQVVVVVSFILNCDTVVLGLSPRRLHRVQYGLRLMKIYRKVFPYHKTVCNFYF